VARFTTRRSLLIAATVLALLVALALGGRGLVRLAFRLAGQGPPPRQTHVSTIAGWMPVRLVSRSYRVPESELYRALGVEPEGRRTNTLDEIATQTGRTSDEVVAIVRTTVADWQANHPDTGGPGPPGRGPPRQPSGPADDPADGSGRPSP
jgi:hypothetical protein